MTAVRSNAYLVELVEDLAQDALLFCRQLLRLPVRHRAVALLARAALAQALGRAAAQVALRL